MWRASRGTRGIYLAPIYLLTTCLQMYGIVRDLIEQCIAQTPDVWEWTDEVARYLLPKP